MRSQEAAVLNKGHVVYHKPSSRGWRRYPTWDRYRVEESQVARGFERRADYGGMGDYVALREIAASGRSTKRIRVLHHRDLVLPAKADDHHRAVTKAYENRSKVRRSDMDSAATLEDLSRRLMDKQRLTYSYQLAPYWDEENREIDGVVLRGAAWDYARRLIEADLAS